MTDTWRWPKQNSRRAIELGQNYYQHAEHYFRLISSDNGAT